MKKTEESIIDMPKKSLCPEIWHLAPDLNGIEEVWQLLPEAYEKLISIASALSTDFSDSVLLHIIGSMTSNQYTENADIDLHFVDKIEGSSDQANLNLRMDFLALILQDASLSSIGKHPIEVYYQENEWQDYMSIGCYDLKNKMWLVGPELADETFNPYSEFYRETLKVSKTIAELIRNAIFSIYETAIAVKKNKDKEFKANLVITLRNQLKTIKSLYDKIRNTRKVFSSPTSKEKALKYRTSRKWKIADAAFKLFDKYGYIAILKKFIEDYELIENSDEVADDVANDILETVKHYINNADKLSEQEIYETEEGFGGNCGIWALKEAKKLLSKGKMVQMVFCTEVPEEEKELLLNNDVPLYHVALLVDNLLYDASGKIDILYLKDFCNDEYRNPDPEIWALEYRASNDPEDKWIEKAIRNCTAWTDESEEVDEGAILNITLAALLAIPGILPAKTILKTMNEQPTYSYIVNTLNKKCKMYGQYSAFQAANIIARTLFAEARNDGEKGMRAVASVILNRANGKVTDFVNVCKKHAYSKKAKKDIYQFSCWNSMKDSEWDPKEFKIQLPKVIKTGSKELKLWEKAMEIASEMLAGKFIPTTVATMYYNPKTAKPAWGSLLKNVAMIGSHRFGILKNHSPFV